jgi:hypothetical protein
VQVQGEAEAAQSPAANPTLLLEHAGEVVRIGHLDHIAQWPGRDGRTACWSIAFACGWPRVSDEIRTLIRPMRAENSG